MSEFLNTGSNLTTIKSRKNVMDVGPEQAQHASWKEVWLLLGAAVAAGVIFWFFLAVGLGL